MDFDGSGFWWTEANAADDNVIAFARRTRDSQRVALFVGNFSPAVRTNYRIGLPSGGRWREAVNTDAAFYGGSGVGNMGGFEAEAVGWHGQHYSAEVTLPPLAALWLVPEGNDDVEVAPPPKRVAKPKPAPKADAKPKAKTAAKKKPAAKKKAAAKKKPPA